MEREQLTALDGTSIRYTGQRLDQGDLDVWLAILHALRLQNLGSQCLITSYTLLRWMGKSDTGKNRATLHQRITRLRAGTVELSQGRYVYIGGLIDEAYKDEETHKWVITLNPKLRALYGADQFTKVDWAVRHTLDGQPLAQWLHGFYSSHAKPFPMRMATLNKLAGSGNALPRSNRQKIRKALDAVIAASKAHGEGYSYIIRGDLVHFKKMANGTQRRTQRKPCA